MQPPRRLALFDLDGTLTRHDTFVPFVLGLLLRHPARWPRVLLLLAPALGYLAGRLDRGGLKGAILHALFRGMPRSTLRAFAVAYAARVVPARLFAQGLEAFRGHLAAGDHVVILSASPDLFVPDIARCLGAHAVHCTQVRWQADRLDGRLSGLNRRGEEKTRVLEQLRAAHPGMPVIAYGNSPSDLDHMARCEEALYINPGSALAASLDARGIAHARWRAQA